MIVNHARQLCSGIHKVHEEGVGQEIHGDELHWTKVGSAAGVISGLSPGTEKAEKICRQPMFLMELSTLLLLLLIFWSSQVLRLSTKSLRSYNQPAELKLLRVRVLK
jgi:hypothetical protein